MKTTERIILSVELIALDGTDARCSMRMPDRFFDAACAGEWVENAIREMRQECELKLKGTTKGER